MPQSTTSAPAGRDAELSTLLGLAAQSRADVEPHVVVVCGDAGLGKTTVIDAFVAAVPDAHTVQGDCLDVGATPLPYAPLVQALRPVLRDPDRWGVQLGGPARQVLSRLVPEAADPATPTRAEAADVGPGQLYEHLLRVVEQTARATGSLVMVIEDVHWCDAASADLLTFLSRNVVDVPLLVVLTVRGAEVDRAHAAHGLLTTLRRGRRTTWLHLAPLDDATVAALVRDVVDDRQTLAAILDRCGGNPLHALELAAGHGEVTDTLADLLMARVDRCDPATRHVLGVLASAGGTEVWHATLQAVTGMDDATLIGAVRNAVATRLVVATDDGYTLRHALIADAVDRTTLPVERRRLNGAIADILITRGGLTGAHAARLARHLRVAGRPDEELEAAYAAALQAHEVFAYRSAVALMQRVLTLWPTVPDSADRTGTDLAGIYETAAACAAGDLDFEQAVVFAEQALNSLDGTTQPERVALAHTLIARGHEIDWGSAEASYRRAMRALPPADGIARAEVEATFSSALVMEGRLGEAGELAQHAVEVARRIGAPAAEAQALINLAVISGQQGRHDDATRLFDEGQSVAENCGSVHQQMRVAMNRSGILANLGDFDAAIAECSRAMAIAKEHGLDRTHGTDLRVNLLGPLIDSGRMAEAIAIGTAAIPLAPEGSSRAGMMTQTGMAAVRTGDIALARRLMGDAKAEMAASQQTWFVAFWGQLAAEVALAEGDLPAALEHARTALAVVTNPDGPRFWAGEVGALVAEVIAAIGHGDDLASVVAAVRQAAADGETPIHAGERLRLEAIAARVGGAPGHQVVAAWEAALAAYTALPMPERMARCHLALAEAHLAGGRRDRAAVSLADAATLAASIGSTPLGQRAADLARSAGVALANRPATVQPQPDVTAQPFNTTQPCSTSGTWRRTGAGWTVGLDGHLTVLADAKGVRDLAMLLANAGREVHVFELTGGGVVAEQLPVLDDVARLRYAREVIALDEAITEAEDGGDEAQCEAARRRREWLVDQLRLASGLGGRTRRGADGEERARQAVSARIRYTLDRLDRAHPALADHLRGGVRLGVRCLYQPDRPVTWVVTTR